MAQRVIDNINAKIKSMEDISSEQLRSTFAGAQMEDGSILSGDLSAVKAKVVSRIHDKTKYVRIEVTSHTGKTILLDVEATDVIG